MLNLCRLINKQFSYYQNVAFLKSASMKYNDLTADLAILLAAYVACFDLNLNNIIIEPACKQFELGSNCSPWSSWIKVHTVCYLYLQNTSADDTRATVKHI